MREKRTKRCIVCGKVKLREYFYTTPLSVDGLRSWCKECWTKGWKINRARKLGGIIEINPFTSGTSKNFSMPNENIPYVVILSKTPRRKYSHNSKL